ncbi:MAG: geranylgeranylglyceryl/heptaprenylglyceryl phosphate synthase, partial [Bacteroidota bacterium]
AFVRKINTSIATHIFVGGSEVSDGQTDAVVTEVKEHTPLPVIVFPGDIDQITEKADALLFLSLISGRNPEYLIGKHVEAVSKLKGIDLEVIPTGYMLIGNGNQTSVERISNTTPISRTNTQMAVDTAQAGVYLGLQMMYLEAGSGAEYPVPLDMIHQVKTTVKVPLVVGGGIRSKQQLQEVYDAGADLVVIGTALENDESFFNDIKRNI